MAVADEQLLVRIAADTASLRSELNRAANVATVTSTRMRRDFKSAGSGFDLMTQGVAKLRGGLAGLAAGLTLGALATKISQVAVQMDNLANTATKLGVATETLQELRFAAEEVGVASSTLDMALQRFTRRVGEAQQGSGELKSVLDAYNIATVNADGSTRAVADVLDDLADVIANATSNQEQLRIAFKAFDAEGAALVSMLRQGSAGLDEFKQKARELGVVVEDEMVQELADANREIEIMVQKINTELALATGNAIVWFRELFSGGFQPVAGAELDALKSKLADLRMERELLEDTEDRAGRARAIDLDRAIERYEKMIKLSETAAEIPPPVVTITKAAPAEAAPGLNAFQIVESLPTPQSLNATATAWGTYTAAVNKNADEIRAAHAALLEFRSTSDNVGAAFGSGVVSGLNSLEDALVGVSLQTASTSDAFRAMALSIVEDIQRILIQQTITGPLSGLLSTALNGLFSGGSGGSASATALSGSNTFFGKPGRAGGGGVRAGSAYMVGERRPELFIPDQSGEIVASGKAPTGGSTVFNITAPGADRAGLSELKAMIRSIGGKVNMIDSNMDARAVSAVISARNRNPKMLGGSR